jgi:phospholipase/carboxylesterase
MRLEYIEVNTTKNPDFSVIWLHGLGADGHNFESIASELRLPQTLGVRFIFPHAPVQPVTINAGFPMRSWFDIFGLDEKAIQDEVGIRKSQQAVEQLLQTVIDDGIPSQKIIMGGFSQGGALALHLALRYHRKLAGAIGLSTYLPLAGLAATEQHTLNKDLPLFLAHGTQDNVVPYQFGRTSCKYLNDLGHPISWHEYPIGHQVSTEELNDISHWIQTILNPH